ncbi:hypothetical protein LTR78_004704 [Recurvomyces mirabilis]|uniref:GPI anchored protein n=1 Tax=Recurvomyces mirabilis TaxID=574656 RepID=A0AAE0WPV9_9PEZI|nr:hypothetical protein LTR78_004704 [Recurvomyces mirabilis]
MAAIASTAVAQNSSAVLTIPFYGYDQQSIVGSVVATSAGVSTIALACAPGTDGNDCGLFPYETLTIGPSTYNIYMSDDQFTGTQMCDTAGVCTESAAGASANFPGVSTTSYAANETANIPVTITAGAALLAGSAPATATSGGTTSSLSSGSGSASQSRSSGGGSQSGAAASSTQSTTGSVTGSAVVPSGTSGAEALAVGVVGLGAGLLAFLL